jgi:CheY-like chemotaxis protein
VIFAVGPDVVRTGFSPAPSWHGASQAVTGPSPADRLYRVVLVDDDRPFRAMTRAVLESDGRVEIVGEASNGVQALLLIERVEPDAALVEGADEARRVRRDDRRRAVRRLTRLNSPRERPTPGAGSRAAAAADDCTERGLTRWTRSCGSRRRSP